MGFFDRFRKNKRKDDRLQCLPRYLYEDAEIEELDRYIADRFGDYKNVFHEIASPDIHLDVCILEPAEEEPCYRLVTMGAGAYQMQVPEKWQDYQIDRAEYVIRLPRDWKLDSSLEEDYWPIKALKDTARLPIWSHTWLSYGHTIQADEDGAPYAGNTRFNSIVLRLAGNGREESRLEMSSGKVINFYEIIALYPEELKYKMENGADALFEAMEEKAIPYRVLDLTRRSAAD